MHEQLPSGMANGIEVDVDDVAVILLPDPGQVPDSREYAREQADALARLGAIRDDNVTLSAVAMLLATLTETSRPSGFCWRYLLVPGPEIPPLTVDVGFRPVVAGSPGWDELIGTELPAPAGSHTADFRLNGLAGRHCLRFALRDPASDEISPTGVLWCTAAVVCRRSLPSGPVDVLAAADTPDIDFLFALLPALYDLVSGESIVETVRASSGPF